MAAGSRETNKSLKRLDAAVALALASGVARPRAASKHARLSAAQMR